MIYDVYSDAAIAKSTVCNWYDEKGESAVPTSKTICDVFGDGTTAERVLFVNCLRGSKVEILIWETENVPALVDDEQIETMIKINSCHTIWNITVILSISDIVRRLEIFQYVNHCNI